jgi:hydroxyacylglutathione hydrolase
LNIAFRPAYATWLGWLVPEDAPLVFVLGESSLDAVMDESLLVGYENFAGYLDGGIEAWMDAGLEVSRTALVGADVHCMP